jgi:DNA-binding transcriptional ArsR family regulator
MCTSWFPATAVAPRRTGAGALIVMMPLIVLCGAPCTRAVAPTTGVVVDDDVEDPPDDELLEHPAASAPTTTTPTANATAPRGEQALRNRRSLAHVAGRVARDPGLDILHVYSNYSPLMDVFEALADPTRRRVVQLLGARPHRAGELADATGMSQPAMSRHLKILLTSGIVEDERVPEDARVRMFKLQPESLVAVQAFLDQLQAEWRTQLRSFKRHVERKSR